MIIFDNTIIPKELFEQKFCCDLALCKGQCCVEGDAGAPLYESEIGILEDLMEGIKPFLSQEGLKAIEKNGVFDFDVDGHFVTPLVNNKDCAFLETDSDGIARCVIEKAWELGKLIGFSDDDNFMKPISCHLYPIRLLEKSNGFIELKYHKWDVCYHARKKGKTTGLSVFEFLKTPLIRKFGVEWYEKAKELGKK